MQSFFDRIRRATVQQETLGAVILVGTEKPSDQHRAGAFLFHVLSSEMTGRGRNDLVPSSEMVGRTAWPGEDGC